MSVLSIELLGVVAFSISGALVAINHKMDIFGVSILGAVTAMGGGFIRDLCIGITPPIVLSRPVYAITAILTSLFIFIPHVRNSLHKHEDVFEMVVFLADTVGLGIFAVSGIQMALETLENPNFFLLVFMGLVSGTGGSVFRDVLCGQTPYIFVKHFYASADIIGSVLTILIWDTWGKAASMMIGAALIIILRLFAAEFRWNLPHA